MSKFMLFVSVFFLCGSQQNVYANTLRAVVDADNRDACAMSALQNTEWRVPHGCQLSLDENRISENQYYVVDAVCPNGGIEFQMTTHAHQTGFIWSMRYPVCQVTSTSRQVLTSAQINEIEKSLTPAQ